MGRSGVRENEEPVRRVWVSAFWMAATPVTNSQYRTYLRATGEEPPPFLEEPGFRESDQPVVGVSFDQAARYCEWLASETGLGIRLPTEAEREKAARGGLEGSVFPWGDDPEGGGHRTIRGPLRGPDPVRATPPNGFGLYHMGDNVHEWCLDVYIPNYYASAPAIDPCAQGDGERRSARGGSWRHAIVVTACAARSCLPPSFHYRDFGFRWVSDR